ncbi:hypothetical protein KP509_29G063000 [Ceratopteris richardii]|uniref:Uncharacterized protein n=1 Tax=Ceratopteris richardii TaxID=49495 RepID=A0A8T2R997_CERRI|nr:hypothetical protein KP509_29G063000 [Ceratopteris richardii]
MRERSISSFWGVSTGWHREHKRRETEQERAKRSTCCSTPEILSEAHSGAFSPQLLESRDNCFVICTLINGERIVVLRVAPFLALRDRERFIRQKKEGQSVLHEWVLRERCALHRKASSNLDQKKRCERQCIRSTHTVERNREIGESESYQNMREKLNEECRSSRTNTCINS